MRYTNHRRMNVVMTCSKEMMRYTRYSKVIVKKPVYQVGKNSVTTAFVFLSSYWHFVDIPTVDDHVMCASKTAMDVTLLVLRQGSYIGVELLDLFLVLTIMMWIRRRGGRDDDF